MPIPEGVTTSYIVKNLHERILNYNIKFDFYVTDYNKYLSQRKFLLNVNNEFQKLLMNDEFISALRWILIKFGMNARQSQLTEISSFSKVIKESIPIFEEILKHKKVITNLDFTIDNESRKLYKLICDIYNRFSEPAKLSYSGGFVIASKTLHFVLPDLFIMIDGAHIGISLYHITDYQPLVDEGKDWYAVIPGYSGKKPNPSPRGQGRASWDSERYCIALLFYKRIYHDWLKAFKVNHQSFLELDEKSCLVSRIIDKTMW